MQIFWDCLKEAVVISYFVFIMMTLVDYLNVWTRGRMREIASGNRFYRYLVSCLLAVFPGCLGGFMLVSFYVHGLIPFGTLAGGMIASSGDEAFVMLTLFPKKALMLFGVLFVLGIVWGILVDWFLPKLKIQTCQSCGLDVVHSPHDEEVFSRKPAWSNFKDGSWLRFGILGSLLLFVAGFAWGFIGPKEWDAEKIIAILFSGFAFLAFLTISRHYLEEHIWKHIIKQHLWRVFLWSLGAFLFVKWGFKAWNLESLVQQNMFLVFLLAGLIGLIPESGPNLIFVVLFSQGAIPFSVLLTSSMVQDGHSMLPMLSYTVKDTILLKIFNLAFAWLVGAIFFFLGG